MNQTTVTAAPPQEVELDGQMVRDRFRQRGGSAGGPMFA
jgi:hypothetical protein